MDNPDPRRPPRDQPAPRWFQRVLPGLLVGALVIGLAALVSPGFREQVALSVSRQQQPYLELYFSRVATPQTQVRCARQGPAVQVSFTVASHLDRPASLPYEVRVSAAGKDGPTQRRRDLVSTVPERATHVTEQVTWPRRRPYQVLVTLPGRAQRLAARCPGEQP